MKIVSLVPSASEILCDLGLERYLVGISHECNFPSSLQNIQTVTSSNIDSSETQIEIDTQVRKKVNDNKPLYEINSDILNELTPDVIITQGVCDVCAISNDQVEVLLKGQLCTLPSSTNVLSLNGRSLQGICDDIITLGDHFECLEISESIVKKAMDEKNKMMELKKHNTRLLCLEWIDPYFSAGHWVPEQIEMAGFVSAIGKPGDQSRVITTDEIIESKPDAIAVICCGYNEEKNKLFAEDILQDKRINHLLPFQNEKIYYFDSDSYFSRPTLRILEGAKQLRNSILN
jgi:iron complex transport system substrate-binding protein|tara:strand:- start:53 stop:919 length:867 start_codon:yes stop_codon:yes gene_type:complete